jgi:small subunit ribosomal protein S8
MLNDTLSNALSHIFNCEKEGKSECVIKNSSKLIKKTLDILKENKYVGEYKAIVTDRGEILKLELIGNINKIGTIKPRFSVKSDNYEKFEKRFLPAKDFGILIVSTPKGLMIHTKAIEKNLGGRLIVYCY